MLLPPKGERGWGRERRYQDSPKKSSLITTKILKKSKRDKAGLK